MNACVPEGDLDRKPSAGIDEAGLLRSASFVVDTSERHPVHVLVLPSGAPVRLSSSGYALLQSVMKGESFESVAERFRHADGSAASPSGLEAAYQSILNQLAQADARKDDLTWGFWFRQRLVPASMVEAIASRLTGAFRLFFVVFSAVILILAGMLTMHSGLRIASGAFWPGYILFLVSLVAHELGHASACARYGAPPADIGMTAYLIYPAFYSNVTAAWKLKRWQRVVVDLGGIYFQLLVGSLYAFLYWMTGFEPLQVAVTLILGSVVFSMNPVLKFDGYWVVADALGVTNLGKQTARVGRTIGLSLLGRKAKPLPWPKWVTGVLFFYTVFSLGFWIFFVWRVGPLVVRRVSGLYTLVSQTMLAVRSLPLPPLSEIMADIFISLFAFLFVARLLGGVWPLISRKKKSTGPSACPVSDP